MNTTGARPWVDSLERYILFNYRHLLTKEEWHGWQYIIRIEKDKALPEDCSEKRRELSRSYIESSKEAASKDPAIARLLDLEPEDFFVSIAYRVLRDHPNDVQLVLCRRCRNLCMTPKAKLCKRCGYSWHHGHTEP